MTTDWEACYCAGQTPWDKGAAAPPLLEWLAGPSRGLAGDVLVPGCGFGHDVRAIAATGHARRVVGLDLSGAAVARSRAFPAAGGETYVEGDLFTLPLAWNGRFDWVFEHTCFCAIDPARRAEYVRTVADALRPDGQLLAIFLPASVGARRITPTRGRPHLSARPYRNWTRCLPGVSAWSISGHPPGRFPAGRAAKSSGSCTG